MSINDFHACLCDEENSALETLRALRSAQGKIDDTPMDGWIPWG